jgi:hypothetical protein
MFRRHLLALCACSPLVLAAAACGGDSDAASDTTAAPSPSSALTSPAGTGTAASSPGSPSEPKLGTPASKFTLLLTDVGDGYFTDRQHTFALDIDNYSTTASFSDPAQGRKLLTDWGYAGGFETGYEPERRSVDVLNGKYYIAVETHLFDSSEGAKQAFAYFENGLRTARRAEPVQASALGNQSSAWKYVDEKIPGSSINGVFHRFVVRRGNMVAIVQTWGAEPLMKVDVVRGLAAVIDQKALGQKEAVEPTATPAP